LVDVTVSVHLHTTLQRRTPDGWLRRLDVTLPPGSTLADLLDRLALPRRDDSVLLVINGRQADTAQVLRDADEVHLIPALSGGAAG
jgi:molybdopterin converting factor small subunit